MRCPSCPAAVRHTVLLGLWRALLPLPLPLPLPLLQTLQDLAQDMEERKGQAGNTKKYEVLYKRDKEMTEFIDAFDSTRTAALNGQKHAQDQIVALLEHISKGLERQHNMPR